MLALSIGSVSLDQELAVRGYTASSSLPTHPAHTPKWYCHWFLHREGQFLVLAPHTKKSYNVEW